MASHPPFELPEHASTIFYRWGLGWCVFCEADWTVIAASGDHDVFMEIFPLVGEAVDEHTAECPNRPPLHNPEGLASWLTR